MKNRTDLKPTIAEAFICQFNEKGPKFSLDELVSAIHISKKTIYKYFDSKTDIYRYILTETKNETVAAQKRIYEDENLPLEEKVREILTIHTSYEKNINIARLYEIKEVEPDFFEELMSAYEDHWDYPALVIDEAKKAGLLRSDLNTKLLISALSASLRSLDSQDALKSSELSYNEAVDLLVDCILNGIVAK